MTRVMQVTETGEEFCIHTGCLEDCEDWIENNAGMYPESSFYLHAGKVIDYGGPAQDEGYEDFSDCGEYASQDCYY